MGNGTGTWKEARLTDELVDVLEVKGAKLVDTKGKEVTTGKMNIKGNKVEFVFDKKDESFLYLAGQTYTLKIDAKIKEGVTAEELTPYLSNEGIPNTAELHIGQDKSYVSNEVYVVPPAPEKPEETKPEPPKQDQPQPKPEEPKQPKPEVKPETPQVLPQTNENDTSLPFVLGGGLILVGAGIYVFNRKKRMN
ncbi:hypothetical protein COE50_05960 [Bacillus anthracis]|nr:hypothetical protein COE50_05960 [Bacillus anthracis]